MRRVQKGVVNASGADKIFGSKEYEAGIRNRVTRDETQGTLLRGKDVLRLSRYNIE